MRKPRHSRISLVVTAAVFLAVLITPACLQSNKETKEVTPAAQTATPTTHEVYVIFEGPWAFAPDPKDANSVIAMAPKAKNHRDLFVQSSDKALAPGVYDLSVPARTAPAAGTVHPNILRAKIEAQNVQHVLDNKLERYAIRLPKPEAYVPGLYFRSRAGSTYPPDASTEKDYATSISLKYTVSTLNGFSVAGSPDSGVFNPLLLQVDTPTIEFAIDATWDADPATNACHVHERETFHELTKLLNLSLYLDFPSDLSTCRDKDPQNPHQVKAEVVPGFPSLFAGGWAGGPKQHLLAAIYFFASHGGACKAPDIVSSD
jgi:hypothetical protein